MLKKIIRIRKILFLFLCMLVLTMKTFSISAETTEIATFEDEVDLPILMYHFLTEDVRNKWAITPENFEADLIYLKENGYETVFMSEVIDYVYNGKRLPEKPIVLTFDDGDSSVHRIAFPMLQKYEMKAVVAIIGKPTDEYSAEARNDIQYYPNITWTQVREMHESGLVEIQNHSYDSHHGNGTKKNKGESFEAYRERLSKDLNKLQMRIKEEIGVNPNTFVYPFGAISHDSVQILKENGFMASLSCAEMVSKVKLGDPLSLYNLGRFLRPQDLTAESIVKLAERQS